MASLLFRAPLLLGCLPWLIACGEGSADNGGPAASGAGGAQSTSGAGSAGLPGTSGTSTAGSSSAGMGGAGNNGGGQAGQSAGGAGAANAGSGSGSGGSAGSGAPSTEKFSFFVTSLKAMVELSKNDAGFGGDLRFGEMGDGAGLKGADKICTTIAAKSMPANNKTWRAFLSATRGADGNAVNAIERVGEGPWYDRTGRLVAMSLTALGNIRPEGADEAILNDLPNEDGVPNHEPDAAAGEVDNHDILTGTNEEGKLFSTDVGFTCNDWTSAAESGKPRCGHSWPRTGGGGGPGGGSGNNWMSALNESGCAPGVWIVEAGPPGENGTKSVGDGGGYGGIYCFALTP